MPSGNQPRTTESFSIGIEKLRLLSLTTAPLSFRHQSRHPAVCGYIQSVATAIRAGLLVGDVARIGIVLYRLEGVTDGKDSTQVVERYVLDVNAFPAVDKTIKKSMANPDEKDPLSVVSSFASDTKESVILKMPEPCRASSVPLDESTPLDLSEQLRAALIRLQALCSKFKFLPELTAWQVYMELRGGNSVLVQQSKQREPVQLPANALEKWNTEFEAYPVRTVLYRELIFGAWIEVYRGDKEGASQVPQLQYESTV